jgi:hypothetical protein
MSDPSRTTELRTRRTVLAAAVGAAAATAASALGRPGPVEAHDADDVRLGGFNTAFGITTIWHQNGSAFKAETIGGTGVWGASAAFRGVYGSSGTGTGVIGEGGAFGVEGVSGDPSGIGGRFWTTASSGQTVGVLGRSASPSGFGVLAKNTAGGTGLQVDGKARFRRSGKTAIGAGHASKRVYLAGVAANSLVFAVLAQSRTNRWVRAVMPAWGSFVVYLNGTVSANTLVSWWVIDPYI